MESNVFLKKIESFENIPSNNNSSFIQKLQEIKDNNKRDTGTPDFVNQNKKAYGSATSKTKDDFLLDTLGKNEKSVFDQKLLDFVFSDLNVPLGIQKSCSALIAGDMTFTVST